MKINLLHTAIAYFCSSQKSVDCFRIYETIKKKYNKSKILAVYIFDWFHPQTLYNFVSDKKICKALVIIPI